MKAKSIAGVFNISKFIRLMRDKRGVRGYRSVSKEIGISHMTYYKIEQRGTTPDLETFIRIVLWMNSDAEQFLFRTALPAGTVG